MSASTAAFQENAGATPLRDLKLAIEGTQLEPILREFEAEILRAGILRLRPRFYLSTEWGVPDGTIAIGIPFYLARPDLVALHAQRSGFVEGISRSTILRYLRHEMGHVVNYAYVLYQDENWIRLFGSITQPYVEEYRPEPFSRRFVIHLPGWYAQMHPDEDWAETFAVWMTPGRDWHAEYSSWPDALAKLEFCDASMRAIGNREPRVARAEIDDDDVTRMSLTLDELYRTDPHNHHFPAALDGALKSIFDDYRPGNVDSPSALRPAAGLIRKLEHDLMAEVYRWTGHFPERIQLLVRHLADRAEVLEQVYPADREDEATVAFTALVTSLAMNHVYRGSYLA